MMGMMMRMIIGRVNEINSSPGMFGSTNHYDAHGNKVGRSSSGFFGSKNHYDDRGRKTVNLLYKIIKKNYCRAGRNCSYLFFLC